MPRFDRPYLENELAPRLRAIPEDARPRWGGMTRETLYDHLHEVVAYSMGRGGDVPYMGNWMLRTVVKRLVLAGVMPIPRNVKAPSMKAAGATDAERAGLDPLLSLLHEYLALAETRSLDPPPHPGFGPMSADEWAVMHYRHFEHHLKQFNA